MHINLLPANCLRAIFQRLSIPERIRLEIVCHRWNQVLNSAYSDVRRLDIGEFILANSRNFYQQDNINFEPTVIGLILRCGPFLIDLSFGSRWFRISQPMIDLITEICLKLERINFGFSLINGSLEKLMVKLAPQLAEISLEESHWISAERNSATLQLAFTKMPKLRSFNIRKVPFQLSHLPLITSQLEEINLTEVRQLAASIFHQFLLTHSHLKSLRVHLNTFKQELSQSTLDIICNFRELHCLELSHSDPSNTQPLSLEPLINLSQSIREFHLCHNSLLVDNILELLCLHGRELRVLDIFACKSLREFSGLDSCVRLERLVAGQTNCLIDSDIIGLGQSPSSFHLQSLHLTACQQVTPVSVHLLINNCPNLQDVRLIKCRQIDNEFLTGLTALCRIPAKIGLQGTLVTFWFPLRAQLLFIFHLRMSHQ